LLSEPLFDGVRVTGPTVPGVIVKIWAAEELLNVSVTALDSPPPEGVIVIVPLKDPFGVTVKFEEALPIEPLLGPVNVYVVAASTGVNELELPERALVPNPLVAVAAQVYAVPFVRPLTVIGLLAPVPETAVPPPTGVQIAV
jgi:hypothetical protein